ncbi:MAG: RHS repeat-associated core domain-containing protein [Chloroflexi bacterium]|nr:RHS repeat-associated core domain-containing protein [Chloroflexota bacterium]
MRLPSALGLYFYNARWYDPALGRFIQPGTIVPEPGNPQALNRYSYCLNDPVNRNDPTGHWGPKVRFFQTQSGHSRPACRCAC